MAFTNVVVLKIKGILLAEKQKKRRHREVSGGPGIR
jgi:hypothetical protein